MYKNKIINQILLAEIMISGDWNFVTKVYNENLKWLAPLLLFSKATQIMDATSGRIDSAGGAGQE